MNSNCFSAREGDRTRKGLPANQVPHHSGLLRIVYRYNSITNRKSMQRVEPSLESTLPNARDQNTTGKRAHSLGRINYLQGFTFPTRGQGLRAGKSLSGCFRADQKFAANIFSKFSHEEMLFLHFSAGKGSCSQGNPGLLVPFCLVRWLQLGNCLTEPALASLLRSVSRQTGHHLYLSAL